TFFRKMQSEYCIEVGKHEGGLGALPSHAAGLSVPHVSKPCLCGCSLRTKAVLHPRPPPVPHTASRALPTLSHGRRQLSSPVTASFKSQLSQSSPKPKAKSQLLSWGRSRVCCNATPLRRLAPMGVWPQGFLNPLAKSWAEKPLQTYLPCGGGHFLSWGATSPKISLVEGDDAPSSLPLLFK
uniref:Uncharacterized protein n=1 Tax=Catagonus wagneri TaxID=51154 RepID=A0A8C3YD19_9CETA